MEDSEMPVQDLSGACVVEEESTEPPGENGQTTADDKTLTLPSDVHLNGNQVLTEDKTTSDANANDKVPEQKGDGDAIRVPNQPETATLLPQRKYSTPKPKHENVAKSKSVWTDIEVMYNETLHL